MIKQLDKLFALYDKAFGLLCSFYTRAIVGPCIEEDLLDVERPEDDDVE